MTLKNKLGLTTNSINNYTKLLKDFLPQLKCQIKYYRISNTSLSCLNAYFKILMENIGN